jgi:hypothetical protein
MNPTMTADEKKIVESEGLRTVDRKDLDTFLTLSRWAITWLDSSPNFHEFEYHGEVISRAQVQELVERYAAEVGSAEGDPS